MTNYPRDLTSVIQALIFSHVQEKSISDSVWWQENSTYSVNLTRDKLTTLKVQGKLHVPLKGQSQVKYFGIYLDENLNWKAHINYLCQQLTEILSAFKLIKNLASPKLEISQLYDAYQYSQICYDGTKAKANLDLTSLSIKNDY